MLNESLKFKYVFEVTSARRRLESYDHTPFFYQNRDGYSREADHLTVFTFEGQAKEDSQRNLALCLEVGRQMGSKYFIASQYKLQWLGQESSGWVLNNLITKELKEEYAKLAKYAGKSILPLNAEYVDSECATLRKFGSDFIMKEQYGVYRITDGVCIKDRKIIIQGFWDHGFPTRRGRPLTVGELRWSGTRTQLEELTELERRFSRAFPKTGMSSKMVSAYDSINREYAWPGSW